MEPATIIATALAVGAAAGVKSVAEQAVKDSYEGLKVLIKTRYPSVNVDLLEQKPESDRRREVVEEDLADADVDQDREALVKAKGLLDAIARSKTEGMPSLGVDIEEVKAASLTIADIIATGTGVKVRSSEFQDDLTIKKVRGGFVKDAPKAQRR